MHRYVIALLLLVTPTAAGVRDLTVEQVRYLLSATGFNPGTVRMLGDAGRYELRSVLVESGSHHNEFLVKVRIDPVN